MVSWQDVLFILGPVLLGWIAGAISNRTQRYGKCDRTGYPVPPPSWVFPVVWTVLYLLLGIASYLVWTRQGKQWSTLLSVYVLLLVLLNLWYIAFTYICNAQVAFVSLILLFVAFLWLTWRFAGVNPVAGLIMIPLLVWLLYASYLTFPRDGVKMN